MKFATDQDAKLFCLEIEQFDLVESADKSFEPDDKMLEIFLKRRKELVPKLKNFRRKQNTKQQWRHDRYKMMRGIKRFHKSTAGKRFHRSLGRFLATREAMQKSVQFSVSLTEVADILKSLSSLKTHAYVELEFFHPLAEELEYRTFIEELIPAVDRVEKNILAGNFSIEEEDEKFFLKIVNEESIIDSLAKRSNTSFEEVKEMWEQILDHIYDDDKLDDRDDINLKKALDQLKIKVFQPVDTQ